MAQDNLAVNDMIDFDLDSLEDLPEFSFIPAGVFVFEGIALGQKVAEKIGTIVTMDIKVLKTIELKNPGVDKEPEPGVTMDYGFPLEIPDNERGTKFSQGALKVITNALKAHYGVGTFKQLVEKFPGTQFEALTTVRYAKDDAEKRFCGIKAIRIL